MPLMKEYHQMSTTPRLELIKVTALAGHRRNIRHDLGPLGELTDSIKSSGILQPLVVAPGKTDGKYVVIAGHRRLAAAKRAGLTELPCLIRADLTGEADQLQAMLIENLQRSELNVIEEGAAYQTLIDLKVDVKSIASKTGRTQKTIRERVKLNAVPYPVQQKLIAHEITLDDALTLQSFAGETERYKTLTELIGTDTWDFSVAEARKAQENEKNFKKVHAELTAAGVWVCLTNSGRQERRSEITKERGGQWFWTTLDEEPEDKADDLVAATISQFGTVTWHRLDPIPEVADDFSRADHVDGEEEMSPEERKAAAARKRAELDAAAEEAAAKRIEYEKIRNDLEVAATVRLAHLTNQLHDADEDTAVRALMPLFEFWLDEYASEEADFQWIGSLLRVVPPHRELDGEGDPTADEEEFLDRFRAVIVQAASSLPITKLAVLCRIADRAYYEDGLKSPGNWRHGAHTYLTEFDHWRAELLDTFGYTWSPIEQSLIDEDASEAAAASTAGK
ncbi:MAG: ParB/RepB/Spo0J family partition protein [Rhodococcus sp. (in: high G+C Gram-positive bacteria)]